MTCRELIDFIMEYDDGTLPHQQRVLFEEHLAVCEDCVHYLASYRTAVKLGRSLITPTDEEVPLEVPEELIRSILSARQADRGSPNT
jgi:anti-sigma factor RsiW